MLAFVLLASVVWGIAVACFIEFTELGRFIALRLTWLSVAIGLGGDFLLSILLLDEAGRIVWWQFVALVALSSIPVSTRGLLELVAYNRMVMDGAKDTISE